MESEELDPKKEYEKKELTTSSKILQIDQSIHSEKSNNQEVGDAEDLNGINPEFVKMYYEHHYDRVARLEEQGLIITNVAMTFSIVVFTFGFSDLQSLNFFTAILLPLTMICINIFAVAYLVASKNWISGHRKRAERVLEIYARGIYLLDRSIFNSQKNVFMGRRKAQLFIHYLLMSAAFLPMLIYIGKLISP